MFYIHDSETGKQESLGTRDRAEATTLLNARNESVRQPQPIFTSPRQCQRGDQIQPAEHAQRLTSRNHKAPDDVYAGVKMARAILPVIATILLRCFDGRATAYLLDDPPSPIGVAFVANGGLFSVTNKADSFVWHRAGKLLKSEVEGLRRETE